MKKAIVIGLDGLEPKIAEAMMQAGELPNLARLSQQGGYSRVKTTYPAQTPVAWSSFATGTNPGGHGIFDFLSRDSKRYVPILSLSRYEQKSPFLPPEVVNMRRGKAVWDVLSEKDLPSIVLRHPCTYPPGELNGRMLSGVGVPDLRGGLGTGTFYTTDSSTETEHSEKVVHVQRKGELVQTDLIGPRNPRKRSDFLFKITIRIDGPEAKATLRSGGAPRELELKEGEWSDWLKVKFKVGLLQSVSGMVRFYLACLEPQFELYASPINFDPDSPLFPISSPPEYASELQERIGTYYTTGMAEDHDGLNNGRFDESAYLAQCQGVMKERQQMMLYELARFESGLFYCLFDTPDRLQHMFWRFREQDHPANCHGVQPEMAHVIEDHYRDCDAVVGQALESADDETLFIVMSDHGMNSFQRGLHLNTWLHDNGFLALKNGMKPSEEAGDFLRSVDWDRTQAYTLGLGGIFLNLKGREENGIVNEDDIDSVQQAIVSQLTGLRDEDRGKVAVRSVVTRDEVYSGPFAAESPDLVVNFSEGYRVSWDTPLGGVPAGLFDDNTKKWAGDHVVDPAFVPGVLFMNRPFHGDGAQLIDLAPTILAALGVPKGTSMEGDSLLT